MKVFGDEMLKRVWDDGASAMSTKGYKGRSFSIADLLRTIENL